MLEILSATIIILSMLFATSAIGAYTRCNKIKFPFAQWGIGALIVISIYAIATDDGYIHPRQQQIVRAR